MPDIEDFGKPKQNISRIMDVVPEIQQVNPPRREPEKPTVTATPTITTSTQEKKPEGEGQNVTKAELTQSLNNIARAIAGQLLANRAMFEASLVQALQGLNQRILSKQEIEKIAKDAVPKMIQDLDENTQRAGNVLMLAPGGTDYPDSLYFGSVASAGLSLDSKVFFGVKCNPNGDDPDLVRIYASEIDGIAVAQTDVTVADNDFAYVQRTRADNTMLITTGASVPEDDSDYFYYKLHQFSVTDGVAKVLKYCRPFAIEGGKIPSNASKNKYMVMCLSADVGATNDPSKITWDWLRMGSLA